MTYYLFKNKPVDMLLKDGSEIDLVFILIYNKTRNINTIRPFFTSFGITIGKKFYPFRLVFIIAAVVTQMVKPAPPGKV